MRVSRSFSVHLNIILKPFCLLSVVFDAEAQ